MENLIIIGTLAVVAIFLVVAPLFFFVIGITIVVMSCRAEYYR